MENLLSQVNLVKLELFSYCILTIGAIGDHISTFLGLTRPHIYETNPVTVKLMTKGLWFPLNLIIVALGILIPYLSIRFTRSRAFYALLAYPIIHGLLRFGACLHNFSLIIK